MKRLPKKPSRLLSTALRDLELCEKDAKYEIEMWYYYHPNNGTCSICMAGAVMVKSLGQPRLQRSLAPYNFPGNETQLEAIDELRVGNVPGALKSLGYSSRLRRRKMPNYHGTTSKKFKAAIRKLISDLKEREI